MPRIITMLLAAILLSGCKQIFDRNETGEDEPAISSPSEQRTDSLRLNPAKREPVKTPSDTRKKKLDTLKPVST